MNKKIKLGIVVGLFEKLNKERSFLIYRKKKYSRIHHKYKSLFNTMPLSKKFYKKWEKLDFIVEHMIVLKHFIIDNAALGNDQHTIVDMSEKVFSSYTIVIEHFELNNENSLYYMSFNDILNMVRKYPTKD